MGRGVRAAPGPRHHPTSPGHPSPVGIRRGAAPIPASLLPLGVHPTERPDTPGRGHPPDTHLPPVPISSCCGAELWGKKITQRPGRGESGLGGGGGRPNLGVPPIHLHCAHPPSYHGVTSPFVPPVSTHGCPAEGWGTTTCVCVCIGGEFGASPPPTLQLPHCSTVLP